MLRPYNSVVQPCDGLSRREILRIGGLAAIGLNLSHLRAARTGASHTAKKCIVLFLMGGPPQHSTWDPKPEAPEQIRGEFGPIATSVPGIQICSLFPKIAKQAERWCFLRAVSTDDQAHSSSGYYMLTGVPHSPMNAENVNPGAPNDFPTLGAMVRKFGRDKGGLPASVRLPMHIFNTDRSVWPGQDAGMLGRAYDPWLFRCEPAATGFQIPELTLANDVPVERLAERRDLVQMLDRELGTRSESLARTGDHHTQLAFDLLASPRARAAFDLAKEPSQLRDRYGRNQFGQSCLLARRLVEAGVSLVHVNWFRGPDEPADNPCWDSHIDETKRLKDVLAPAADQAISALIEDLADRGQLEETLVLCLSEFGRTPKFNARGGRDHWGHVFSVALAGGGVVGGHVHGASDRHGAYPRDSRVTPQDLTATTLHLLGINPESELIDPLGRPFPASRGSVIQTILK